MAWFALAFAPALFAAVLAMGHLETKLLADRSGWLPSTRAPVRRTPAYPQCAYRSAHSRRPVHNAHADRKGRPASRRLHHGRRNGQPETAEDSPRREPCRSAIDG